MIRAVFMDMIIKRVSGQTVLPTSKKCQGRVKESWFIALILLVLKEDLEFLALIVENRRTLARSFIQDLIETPGGIPNSS
jgi:hypothetical protein